ncbi:Protein ROH1-like [Dillenia turbinata]|uniref:Protein ROH1-like n=1 Tax=Dillenia turbinata TaxID=194707 RepID=A0AAN8WCS3_9MAGN
MCLVQKKSLGLKDIDEFLSPPYKPDEAHHSVSKPMLWSTYVVLVQEDKSGEGVTADGQDWNWDCSKLATLGRTLNILGTKREQVHSLPSVELDHNQDHHDSTAHEVDQLESFQLLVADKFNHLLASSCNEDLLSLLWIRKLFDAFLCCLEEFRVILFKNKTDTHLADDFLERSI